MSGHSSDEDEVSKSKEKKLKKEIKKLKNQNMELSEGQKALEKDLEKANIDREKALKKSLRYKEKSEELEEKIIRLQEELDSKEEEKKETKQKKNKIGGGNGSSQYDIIVKINSLIAAKDGWTVEFKDKENIEKKFKQNQIAVGVMGRENVGKTYLVNKICGENFASGYYTNTEGLSIKYCDEEFKQLKVLLDSAGMNSAIFFYNYYEAEVYYKNKDRNISIVEYEKIKELMINDRCMTEYFIQNFVLDSCNVILIIVEQLTQNDQKMIERIKHLYSFKKNIIIIHNLFKLELKEQAVQRAQFEIEGAFRAVKQNISGSDVFFYIEKANDSKMKKNIVHLIFGKEGCESGNYFNEASFKHLMKIIEAEVEISEFDLLTKLNKYWMEKNRIYFNNFMEANEIPQFELIAKQEVEKKEKKEKKGEKKSKKNNDGWFYRLNTKLELNLKAPEFNVLGTMKDLDMNYHIYSNGKREKIYYFELPGCEEKPAMTMRKLPKENEQVMTLNIKTTIEKPENFKSEYGGLNVGSVIRKLKVNDEFGEYKCDKSFTDIKNGILKMKFILKEDEDL